MRRGFESLQTHTRTHASAAPALEELRTATRAPRSSAPRRARSLKTDAHPPRREPPAPSHDAARVVRSEAARQRPGPVRWRPPSPGARPAPRALHLSTSRAALGRLCLVMRPASQLRCLRGETGSTPVRGARRGLHVVARSAGIVQRQDHRLPLCRRGFESRYPLSSRPSEEDRGLQPRARGFDSLPALCPPHLPNGRALAF